MTEKLRIYVAAPWVNKPDALAAKEKFEAAGFEITSHWITRESHLTYADLAKPEHEDELVAQAVMDVEDIIRSDIFVILNLEKSEGKATEFGFAYGMDIPVILVGDRTRNIFYFLPNVFRAETVEQAIEGIQLSVQGSDEPSEVEVVN